MGGKAENFNRLAEKRVTESIKKIRLVGNLANKNNYEYNEKQVKQIINALENEIRILKNKFKEEEESREIIFKFNEKNEEE
ncbi:hypothetical protein [Guptibacillus hwajinpoensis]|uniref:hypothetical protein n=1 Tax=Guptibacillus hwajinpoensis TaxID=208199 RepID=UPI0024B3A80F|nr:hypothetical protein [Pseudalkalibacillus hwajinpoensis]